MTGPGAEGRDVQAKAAEFAQLGPPAGAVAGSSFDTLKDVPITIAARLGHVVLPVGEILKLGPGAVVELEETVHHPVELTVRGVPFAVGEVVVVEDRFAVRIKSLLPPPGGKAGE